MSCWRTGRRPSVCAGASPGAIGATLASTRALCSPLHPHAHPEREAASQDIVDRGIMLNGIAQKGAVGRDQRRIGVEQVGAVAVYLAIGPRERELVTEPQV